MTLAERSLGGFPHGREGGNQKVIKGSAFSRLFLEVDSARLQRIVGEGFQFLFEGIDLANPGQIAADAPLIGGSKQLAGNGADHSGTPQLVGRLYHAVLAGFASGTPECGTFRANST